ncbi:MAG: sigma 54-interacting transcriptional regulator [Myxococcales bacterium]|nr:sigma 54-interacting transcriptional regulator [Myxococcales bacterium]
MRRAWTRMAAGRLPAGAVPRPAVRSSWARCQAFGLRPRAPSTHQVGPDDLARRRAAQRALLGCALPAMERLHTLIRGSDSIVVLTDADGVILRAFGDPEFMAEIPIAAEGTSWHERHLGTNGVGTCLAETAPTQIVGAEHFFEPIQVYTCSAAPIRGADGRVIACLDISSPVDHVHEHTLGMVAVAAQAIEQQLTLQSLLEEERAIFQLLQSGIIALDAAGRLRNLNKKASEQLGLSEAEDLGRPITELFSQGPDFAQLAAEDQVRLDQPVVLVHAGHRFSGHMSTSCLHDAEGRVRGVVAMFRERERIQRLVARESGLRAVLTFEQIIGTSLPLGQCVELARIAAGSTSNVLLLGESGTGKELFAQAIHNASARAAGPFVAVNCGAIPRDLVQSELFGYRGGAFTGARHEGHTGKLELAHGGTIFLDEIGDMPLDAQVSLLRFLETRELTRVGDQEPRAVDVRIIAATHVDLVRATAEQRFREDLFYRLNVLSILIPPLRARRADIPPLAEHFLARYAAALGKPGIRLSSAAMAQLQAAPWPGNIRQLENAIERAVNVVRGRRIDVADLPDGLGLAPAPPATERRSVVTDAQGRLRTEQRRQLEATLRRHGGNVRRAAQELGVARSTVYQMMRRHGLTVEPFRA